MNAPPNQNCPEADVLQELAAGIGSPELAQQTMQHVARCATCSAALRRYISEFSEEQSPENAAIFNQLQSSKPEWQKRLVRDQMGGGKRFPWLKLVPAMAALAVAIFAVIQGPSLLADFKVNQAQKQIATAFAGRRTTEMRLPSVNHSDYRPFPIELGGENGRSLDEVPTSLHDASGAANQNLLAAKADPRWLQVQGLALLWESTPSSLEKAEKDFERARSAGLATPSLEIDLAASYFERDSRAEHPNLQRTLNLLSEVLSKPALANDDRASALFNLALAYEKTQAWDLAVSTWEKYLQVDSSSAWTAEAQQHLKEAKAKISSRPQQSYSDPSFFLQQKAQGALRPEDPEQYQQKALTQWLPAAVADKSSDAYRALNGLAEVFAEHQDLWWRDFLKETKPSDLDAVRELSGAVLSNEHGKYDDALAQSRIVISTFKSKNNIPGELIARVQETYALRSKLQGANCLARAGPLLEQLSLTKYQWLQGQLALEKAQCRSFHGDLAESDSDSQVSLQIASRFRFPVLEMRILGISASMHSQQGRCDGAWEQGTQGLARYWQGAYPGERLDQFYAVLWQCTQQSGALYISESILNHTLQLRQDPRSKIGRNLIREGLLHLRLRNMFLAQKQYDRADAENRKASMLLETVPEPYAKEYRMLIEIEPAELQLQQGDPNQALATLKPVAEHLKSIQDNFIPASYYRLMGDIQWELKRLDEAAVAYQAAINIAETPLANLQDRGDRVAWLRATDDSYRGLVRVLLAQNKAEEALNRWEWYKSKPLLRGLRSGDTHFAGIKGKAETTIGQGVDSPFTAPVMPHLVYANFKDGLQIWDSDKRGMHSAWVSVHQQEFERIVRSFTEHCATPDSNLEEIREQGQWLYGKLLQPIISELPEGNVITVELDRSANNLALEALTNSAGAYFGEKYSVVYSPGIWLESTLRPPKPILLSMPLLLLDASHAPGAGYLPGMEDQKNSISRLFPETKIVDSTKTEWTDLHARAGMSEIFHYMGHGRLDGKGTSLDYNGNQSLSAQNLAPEFFKRSQLVVLAACSTGKDIGMLNTNSLVHAFWAARVPVVIASHWNVDSATTSDLMTAFYQHLARNSDVAQSMFQAREEILKTRPHPYYWAGFSIAGRAN
jgi:CHAT domain-containing protein